MGMADLLGKRIVCVFYNVTLTDFDSDEDGRGPVDGLNIVDINALDSYFSELAKRVRT
jgi:hypothetical protein